MCATAVFQQLRLAGGSFTGAMEAMGRSNMKVWGCSEGGVSTQQSRQLQTTAKVPNHEAPHLQHRPVLEALPADLRAEGTHPELPSLALGFSLESPQQRWRNILAQSNKAPRPLTCCPIRRSEVGMECWGDGERISFVW